MTVLFLRTAEKDLVDIIEYIAKDDIITALDYAHKLEVKISELEQNPLIGKPLLGFSSFSYSYRVLVVESHLIFYTNEDKLIRIHRILHQSRDYFIFL